VAVAVAMAVVQYLLDSVAIVPMVLVGEQDLPPPVVAVGIGFARLLAVAIAAVVAPTVVAAAE